MGVWESANIKQIKVSDTQTGTPGSFPMGNKE
jgi:hypothetical protein